jgi:hypothetical protein
MLKEGSLLAPSGACYPGVEDSYTYPVLPGSKEWQTADDAYTLVQLPDGVLKSISTLGLIDALVRSPLFSGSFLFSSSTPVDTWHRYYERFNSARELFKRDNAGHALIKYYQAVDFDCIESSAGDENFRPGFELERIFGLEFLFTRQEILNEIEHRHKQEPVETLLSRFEQYPERQRTLIPVAHVMLGDQYPPMVEYYRDHIELYKRSIGSGYVFSTEQSDLIVSLANSFIDEK